MSLSLLSVSSETDGGTLMEGVMASDVPRKVQELLANVVLDLFTNCKELPTEHKIKARLIRPLEETWRAHEVYKVLQGNPTVSNFCGKVFKNGEPAIFCKDCQTDPTCCLCLECFEKSEHKKHNYRMFASGGGGCCDCGDPEAWTEHVYCNIHKPLEKDSSEQADPIAMLSYSLVECSRSFFSTVIWYCMTVLNWEESRTLPPDFASSSAQTILEKDTFVAFLINDEVHTYDEVIMGLHSHLGLSHTAATDLATYVDRKGRGILRQGTEQECLTAQTNINKSLRHSPLGVKIFHTAIVSHQSCAIYLLNFLKELAEKSEGFCRLLAMVMIEPSLSSNNQCLLDRYFLTDNSLWIEARLGWSRLIMSSIFKDFEYKKQLAVILCKNYPRLAKNFLMDTHHHDVCAINLTVQLFTVPSLCRMLVSERGVLEQIINTLNDIVAPFINNDQKCLNLHSKDYKHERIAYILYDLRYVLRNRPDVWTDQLRSRSLDAVKVFLQLLASMENMDAVRRQYGSHIEQEPAWENSFNFSIITMQAILLFIDWCTSDQRVLCDSVSIALKKFNDITKLTIKNHAVEQRLVGKKSQELILFDILKEKVSFHHPLPRFIAGLLAGGASRYNMSLVNLLRITPDEIRDPLLLMEPCSRSVVMASQVLAGMWKRNGYGVLNQALHYQLHLSRAIMYDKDIIMLQSMAAILDPGVFLYALLYKYRLEKWLVNPQNSLKDRKERGEDAVRFLISELEEFLFLLIVIFCERYKPGIGEGMTSTDTIRRELIHILFLGPLPHSHIMKKFKMSDNDNEVNQLIKELGVLRRISGKSVFELKEKYHQYYDPFYYHHTKVEQSKAEDTWRKLLKAAGGFDRVPASPPCQPPPFTIPYQGILRLLRCPVLIKIFHGIFSEATKEDSKIWSMKLLHQAVHLCSLMIAEEQRLDQNVFARLCIGLDGSHLSILPLLEVLQSSQRVEERRYILTWIVKQLRKARNEESGGSNSPMLPTVAVHEGTDEVDSATPTKKRLMAEEYRKRMMDQIAQMQKQFYDDHKEELELIESTGPTNTQESFPTQNGNCTSCAVGVSAMITQIPQPMSATCILCQEESPDVSMETEKTYIMAACVQRSSVLKRSVEKVEDSKDIDFMSCHLNSRWGIFTGGCGHTMHASCWKRYLDSKQQEHRRRFFIPIPGHSVRWQEGEFLCPLCQTFGNTVLPLASIPAISPQAVAPACPMSLKDIRELLSLIIELGDKVNDESGDYDVSQFEEKIQILFPNCPFSSQPCSSLKCELNAMQGVFAQRSFMQGYALPPNEKSQYIPVAIWQNCAFTISGLECSAREEGKFLISNLSSRQMDCIRSLIQLASKITDKVDTKKLSEYANELITTFLPDFYAFSEHPSIVDMNVFSILVYLHFILSALINRLTHTKQVDGNPLLPPLTGLVDECLVSVAISVLIMQYLLCYTPVMETDTPTDKESEAMDVDQTDLSPELREGHLLQKLWTKLRGFVDRDFQDNPPDPYSLYIGIQEHLYPFLQSAALFFHCLSGINFVHSSASEASHFSDLCKYLGLPNSLPSLFENPLILKVAQNLCAHPNLTEIVRGTISPNTLLVMQPTRKFITLPESFSDLIARASHFECPRTALIGGDGSQAAMLCLLCGEMICTNSYCCRKTLEEDDGIQIGGLTQHSQICGGGFGVALWILESYVVLLNATELHHVRGCTVTPPYMDEYGEPDPGLRRGNPLKLNLESYKELQKCWINHQLPERICKEMEHNMRLLPIHWALM